MPKELAAKKAIINMKNNDDQCFKWAVTRALNPIDDPHGHPERITKQLKESAEELNWSNIVFPVEANKKIDIFEKKNNLSINVHAYDGKIYPIKTSENYSSEDRIINLLLLKDGEKSHYCLIKDFARLVDSQI